MITIASVEAANSTVLDVLPWAALVAAASSFVTYLLGRHSEVRDRRRHSFGAAYQAAKNWVEAVYRVRRRDGSPETQRSIVDHMHQLQEQIDYHRGWIASESPTMASLYDELVECAKAACKKPLQQAWAEPPRDVADWTRDGDIHPALNDALQTADQRFLKATRRFVSPWLLPRLWLRWGEPKQAGQETPDSTTTGGNTNAAQ